jgi:hypothetical protein
MRKAAVAVLLLLALGAVVAYGEEDYDRYEKDGYEKDGYDHEDGEWGHYHDHKHSHNKLPYV